MKESNFNNDKTKIMKKLLSLYIAVVFLLSCSSHKEEKKNDAPAKNDSVALNSNDYLQITGDSVEIPSFEIEVSFSPKAEEKLKTMKETIIVAAYFSGIPKDTTLKDYLKYGEIAITSNERELSDNRVAKFEEIGRAHV